MEIVLDIAQLRTLAEHKPDALGELLRNITFATEGLGCYSNFDLVDGFRKLDTVPQLVLFELMGDDALVPDEAARAVGYRNTALGLSVYWHWDGDGVLIYDCSAFTLVNCDCKKTTGWTSVNLNAELQKRGDYVEIVASHSLISRAA